MSSFTEENYLKAIYKLSGDKEKHVSTNAIAGLLNTKASSVTDMLKKLADKKFIRYKKYRGVTLANDGKKVALKIIRKHRLWELFLVEHLNFKWDEVHEIAEQLEHIISPELVKKLDRYLKYPKYDPHGDPIPDKDGNIHSYKKVSLTDLSINESAVIVGVKDSSALFLQYLENVKLVPGTKISVINRFDYDNSISVSINGKKEIAVSNKVSKNLYVRKINGV